MIILTVVVDDQNGSSIIHGDHGWWVNKVPDEYNVFIIFNN